MVSPSRAQGYAASQADVVGLAHDELEAFWDGLDRSNAVLAKAQLGDFMVALVETYGAMSGTFAADFYDELRIDASPGGRYIAQLADGVPADRVRGSSDWAVQPLFGDLADDAAALQRLRGAAQRLVQEQGRQTLMFNVERDPSRPRWARMPVGETCRWCTMLASRGADYTSRASAVSKDDGGAFHDDCDCQPIPSWSDDDLPYDPQVHLDKYLADRAATKSDRAPTKSGRAPTSGGFESLTADQLQAQIRVTEGLKDSEWRTAQLQRLRTRLTQLR